MKYFNSHFFVGIFLVLISLALVPAEPASASEQGKVLRAYISLPFGGKVPATEDVQLGLQMIQEVYQTNSGPIDTFSETTVLDFAFNNDGLSMGEVMGFNMIEIYRLMNEPTTLGLEANTIGGLVALALGGAAVGAATLCMTDTICNSNKPAPVTNACAAFGNRPVLGTNTCTR